MLYNEDDLNSDLNGLLKGGEIKSVLFTSDECTIQLEIERYKEKYRVEINSDCGELDVIVSKVVERVEEVFRN